MNDSADESAFLHQRHKPPARLEREREIVVVVPQMQSQVNLARIVRAAGCLGIRQVTAIGQAKLDRKIARDAADFVELTVRRSIVPALRELQESGHLLVALEQATNSHALPDFSFHRRTALLIGHERQGVSDEALAMVDAVVEIPVFGQPASYNAATSAAIAMYEYCRQFPVG